VKAPFIWFGGKRRVASIVWEALGDAENYVEPFAGSLAVLLARPTWHRAKCETVNDIDRFLSNFWRALALDPGEVAGWTDWPVNECDLFARHLWLVNEGRQRLERLEADPDFYDAKVAGWWVWGLNSWIGSGWCSGEGPWELTDEEVRKRPHLGSAGQGVNRQLPHLGSAGQGVNRQLPHLGSAGRGGLYEYFEQLASRLRSVRVCCGDWSRVVTDGALSYGSSVAVFLDPPYALDGRTGNLYAVDKDVSAGVRRWALEHGDDARLRIVLAGYEGEHEMPAAWRVVEYSASRAYGTTTGTESLNTVNRHRERLWFSPHCLVPDTQIGLFEALV
jgi:DNA adenine methylase